MNVRAKNDLNRHGKGLIHLIKSDLIANAFYDENFKELERLTGIKAENQHEFEIKFEEKKGKVF